MSSFRFNHEGGIERVSYELASRLAERLDLTLVATAVDPEPEPPLTWLRVPARTRPSFMVPLTYSAAATRSVTTRAFDIVHNQGGCAARSQDVITAHSCHRAWWDMKLHHGEVVRALANPFHHAVLHVERSNYRPSRFRRVIAVSQSVGRELTHFYDVDPDRITVIPNAVDTARFQPPDAAARRAEVRARHQFSDDDVVLLFVGKEFRRKGLAPVIDALPHLPPNARLLVVGGDDPAPFRARAARLGVASRVVFAGHTSSVESAFQAGDVFVFPTTYEAFGLVVLEAAAAGLPVVATPLGVSEDLVVDGRNGAIVDHDPVSIVRALAPIVADRDMRRRLGEQARRDAARQASWSQVADRTYDVYQRVHEEKLAGHIVT
ncbi:UDP-glucose:(heptosyl)LPS alpha-1,3-glucosyltransferase [Luteimicrobium subarcticum]|uniref:UDP-glucose:(Heptosyl)LPS alpha-1,3-glucosyltransferase n=2 Tax=Luteimicrobium subarcticum TaxID=620910 RepID=A0A2M8WT53_9MICO|nr:UDP-glucose:(heptosyl)LPS alpha-1,3-glucosyltransferase [Luteimicrobium subarcticum]